MSSLGIERGDFFVWLLVFSQSDMEETSDKGKSPFPYYVPLLKLNYWNQVSYMKLTPSKTCFISVVIRNCVSAGNTMFQNTHRDHTQRKSLPLQKT